MRKENKELKMNLQFFAEADKDSQAIESEPDKDLQVEESEPDKDSKVADPEPDKEPSVQDLLVELAKLKKAQEKAASEAASYKKKYNEKLSEKERVDAEKAEREAEREEEYQQLLRENKINKLEKYYLGELHYTPEEAMKMAVAEVDGDFDAKLTIQLAVDKRKKKEYEIEFIKSNPQINAGVHGDNKENDAFLSGFASVKPIYGRNKGGK